MSMSGLRFMRPAEELVLMVKEGRNDGGEVISADGSFVFEEVYDGREERDSAGIKVWVSRSVCRR